MRIHEVMSRNVALAHPDYTIQEAARIMLEADAGILPVGEDDRLVGMISDRDIAARAVALGKGPDTKVRDVMSPQLLYCFEDEEVHEVARNMSDERVRRLPVVSRDKKLVGIVSVGDLARSQDFDATTEAIEGVSQPGGPHSQSIAR